MIILTLPYGTIAILSMVLFLCFVGVLYSIYSLSQKNKKQESENHFLWQKEKELSLEMIRKEQENERLKEVISTTKSELQQKEWEEKNSQKILCDKVTELSNAQRQFESEKQRIISESQNLAEKNEEEKYRLWNDHEQEIISRLKNECQSSHSQFVSYQNSTLPPVFDGSIKPDFCILFNKRYIVFDAKKSKNIKSYLSDQAKITVEKYKDIPEISKTIFFIIPEESFHEITEPIISLKGWKIIVITPQSISATLFLLKKTELLEEYSDINPEERESIISNLLEYKNHIAMQNSVNILLAEQSFHLAQNEKSLPEHIQKELKKKEKVTLPFSLQKAKSLSQNTETQQEKVESLKTPKILV